jgi:hypothetical protein
MAKKTLLGCSSKAIFDAFDDALKLRLDDPIIHFSPLLFAGEQPAVLHEPQMLGSHRGWQFARRRQFPDGKVSLEQHLYHPQTMRVR